MRHEFVCKSNRTHWINESDVPESKTDEPEVWHDFCPHCGAGTDLFSEEESPAEFSALQVAQLEKSL